MGHNRPDPLARPAGSPRRPTVLIADDDPSVRETLSVVLGPHGYRIFKADDGPGALDVVRRHRVDVVLLDAQLPAPSGEPDGFALLGQLRARFPDVEVIMCSVDRDVDAAVRAVKLGAFDYLCKDFGSFSRAAEL